MCRQADSGRVSQVTDGRLTIRDADGSRQFKDRNDHEEVVMPPIFIPPPRPAVRYRPAPPRSPAHLHHLQQQQLTSNSQSAGQRIQQMRNQARLSEEIVHRFFENLTKLAEQLKDALKG
jgi:hypothetical protein